MAVIESPSSDLLDPLRDHSVISLFPRTFNDAPNSSNSDNLEFVHGYLKSMELRSPEKHFEKAKGIVQGDSEIVNSKLPTYAVSESKNEADHANGIKNPQERRPALGHKRARFSLKPNINQSPVNLDINLNIDQLQDPVEFFSAYEKLEYAKEEIQRQTGGNTIKKNEQNQFVNPHRRRPGILGKSVSYKHQYSSVVSENGDILISSQETLDQDNLSPSNFLSQEEATNRNVEMEESELAESISKTENSVNDLLDELLSSNIEDLDGDGALSLLQERLQIKPLNVDKFLPDLSDIGKADFMDLEEELPKSKKILSDIQNMMKGSRIKTPLKSRDVAHDPVHSLASPTPLKSPFAALSLLNKRNSRSNPFSDPFSTLDIDLPSRTNLSSYEDVNRLSDQHDTRKELSISGELNPPVEDELTITTVPTGLKKIGAVDSLDLSGKSGNLSMSITDVNIRSSDSQGEWVDCSSNNNVKGNARSNSDTTKQTDRDNEMAENVGHVQQGASSSVQPYIRTEDSSRVYADTDGLGHGLIDNENVKDMQQAKDSFVQQNVTIGNLTTENFRNCQSILGKSDLTGTTDIVMDGQPTVAESPAGHQNKHPRKSSRKDISNTRKDISNTSTHGQRKRKEISRRQSLTEAGTSWETGNRRSKRIKSRPLQYWKGERFLYGRVHESLTTVIGLKYISPAKGSGEPKFKVTSYVSDKHKDLVELAALH